MGEVREEERPTHRGDSQGSRRRTRYGKAKKVIQGEGLGSTDHPATTSAMVQPENVVALAAKRLTRGLVEKAFEKSPEDARPLRCLDAAGWQTSIPAHGPVRMSWVPMRHQMTCGVPGRRAGLYPHVARPAGPVPVDQVSS